MGAILFTKNYSKKNLDDRQHVISKNSSNIESNYIVYWVQKTVRIEYNYALKLAIKKANEYKKQLMCVFLDDPQINVGVDRNNQFMFSGLLVLESELNKLGINFKIFYEEEELVRFIDRACFCITDFGYLNFYRKRLEKISSKARIPIVAVESDVVVPVEVTYPKEAYNAFVLRRKIKDLKENYIKDFTLDNYWDKNSKIVPSNLKNLEELNLQAGELLANINLQKFVNEKVENYQENKNNPELDATSKLSKYLHFGHISPIKIIREIRKSNFNTDVFEEELLVRRELAVNFTYYNNQYNKVDCLPKWAIDTLEKHKDDPREYIYNLNELENAKTHDPYWNAAQLQMVKTGYMHGYMRMYWGKKVIEWTREYSQAYQYLIYLNNKYELDGRDPNGYAGIAWCFGKHDRPWFERPIFGTIRYMNSDGLKRKFKIDSYISYVNKL